MPYFAYFLTEIRGEPFVRPVHLHECYDAADIGQPGNLADVIKRSTAFIRDRSGHLQLARKFKLKIAASLGATFAISVGTEAGVGAGNPDNKVRVELRACDVPSGGANSGTNTNVMVVHGRDAKIRDDLFGFLRAIGLNPIEWEEAVRVTGKGTPYVGEILDAAFSMAQAVVVLLTPDEHVELKRELCTNDTEYERNRGFQSRPNVWIEAGMALARNEAQTIITSVGSNRLASDLAGRHVIYLDNSPEARNNLAQRLKNEGCPVNTSRSDWLRVGDFSVKGKS